MDYPITLALSGGAFIDFVGKTLFQRTWPQGFERGSIFMGVFHATGPFKGFIAHHIDAALGVNKVWQGDRLAEVATFFGDSEQAQQVCEALGLKSKATA